MSDHVVNTIRLQMPVTGYEDGVQVQSKAKHWTHHTLPYLLEKHLDDLGKPDEIIYLDTLTIDLPDFPWNLSSSEWHNRLSAALSGNVSHKESAFIIYKQWIFFLKSGNFERNAIIKSVNDIEEFLILHLSRIDDFDLLSINFSGLTLSFWKRLLNVHKQPFILMILQRWLDLSIERTMELMVAARRMIEINPDVLTRVFNVLFQMKGSAPQKKMDKLINHFLSGDVRVLLRELDRSGLKNVEIQAHELLTEPVEAYIDCPNAGIVILFPYIKGFLENVQLIRNDVFISEQARLTAIQALYHLVSGNSKGEENEYVMMKIICGIPADEFVQFDGMLPEIVLYETGELLTSVIEHWGVLQNTSIEGLREIFLKRPGKLSQKNEQYILQVEESGVDVLLDKMPWGFRNYRLPWMQYPVITEWY